jgi:hypothetical protein
MNPSAPASSLMPIRSADAMMGLIYIKLEMRSKNRMMDSLVDCLLRVRQEYEKAKPELEALRGSISSS